MGQIGVSEVSDGNGRFDNLPDVAKIIHSKGFSCGRKDAGVKEEIEGPKVSLRRMLNC